MFGPRSQRYPMLQAYLAARPTETPLSQVPRNRLAAGIGGSFAFLMGLGAMDTGGWPAYVLAAAGAAIGGIAFWPRKGLPPTPEQELSRRADGAAAQLRNLSTRLHRALHPGVGAVLEECVGYAARISAAVEGPGWADAAPQWEALRNEARAATKIAMDEALVHAGATLAYTPPTRPLEGVSDALEDIGFGPLVPDARRHEPVPPGFMPVRDLAERLRELAVRCETAATQRRHESPEPISMAFRRLDATLGEMRQMEEAEGELRQQA